MKASGSEAKGHPEHDVVPDSGFMSRPSVAGFLLSPPGTAEAEEAGARGKRVSPNISARLPSSVLLILCSQEWEAACQRPNLRGTRGRCQAPSAFPPKGCGGPAARAPSGALCADARFDRPSRASALASLSPSRAGGRGAPEAAGPRHAGGRFARHPRFLVSPDRVGTVAARDRAWLCPTEAQGAGDGGGYCVW